MPIPDSSLSAKETDLIIQDFQSYLKDQEIAIAVAAIKALTGVIKRSTANTMMELELGIRAAADTLKNISQSDSNNTMEIASSTGYVYNTTSNISLTAASELFLRYVTRCFLEFDDFEQCKVQLIERGELFAETSLKSRNRISELGHHFIRDDMVILTHGGSRVVSMLLARAAQTKQFSVVVTEGRPRGDGFVTAEALAKHKIPTTIIPDTAIGYVMEKVDLVIVGAEGVVENGGLVNRIGTFSLAMAAKAMKKPFYVAAESYKFARLYPLNQSDLPESKIDARRLAPCSCKEKYQGNFEIEMPLTDYTPPQYITLLFTDIGVLTPSAVSDELIKLYQ